MNLYFRLFLMLITARYKKPVSALDEFVTEHRVLPNDLDLLGHMNNGRYFTVTDIARIELLIRAGIWQKMRKRKIYPVMAGETVQFRKPLTALQKYRIITNILGWDENFIYVEHLFKSDHDIHALMMVKIRMIGEKSTGISPQEILQMADSGKVKKTRMSETIIKWNLSTDSHCKKAT